jgi:hypothetical protein
MGKSGGLARGDRWERETVAVYAVSLRLTLSFPEHHPQKLTVSRTPDDPKGDPQK